MCGSLRGITWDHARGYDPLVAVSKLFQAKHPGCHVIWEKRSLKDFGDYPLEKLIPKYDLVMLDHPFTGEALAENLLSPLNGLLSPEHLALQEQESLGPSFSSYIQGNQVMALPVDAAALVSASGLPGKKTPETLAELWGFCRDLGRNAVAAPLCSVDVWCIYLTLCSQCSNDSSSSSFFTETQIDEYISLEAIELLYELISCLNPQSFFMNPITLFDAMTADNAEILYAPFAFGYTNYSRTGYRQNRLQFFDAPILGRNNYSTLLGGVGIGISAQSRHSQEAAEFVQLLTSVEIQQGIFTHSGGQPAHRSAWLSEENNEMCGNFFSNTIATLERAYVRPRFPKFNLFQEQASTYLHRAIQEKEKGKLITAHLNQMLHQITGGFS